MIYAVFIALAWLALLIYVSIKTPLSDEVCPDCLHSHSEHGWDCGHPGCFCPLSIKELTEMEN